MDPFDLLFWTFHVFVFTECPVSSPVLSLILRKIFLFISITSLRPAEHFNCEIFGQNIHTNNNN